MAAEGAAVFFGGQDGWGIIRDNAAALKINIRETNSGKVNIIAHPKGGLDTRYMISSLKMAEHVASLTTVSTPHRGSAALDRLAHVRLLLKIVSPAVDGWNRFRGDKHPDFYAVCRQLSAVHMKKFNKQNPDIPGVYYQSYTSSMGKPFLDMRLALPH